jgi:signal transduction histidine kinase
MHAIADGPDVHRAVLVRDRANLLPTDRALLLASEAQANRHVLTGLVHAAKGPLNNFNLTLALLSAAISRGSDAGSELAARRERYLEVLRNEAVRLAACIDEIHALTLRHEPTNEAIDVVALSTDCARVLRHGATMREVVLDLDVPSSPLMIFGDPHLVRLALLSFAISVLDLTSPGGRVGWRVAQADDACLVTMTTTESALPPALAASLFRLSCTAESHYSAAITGRLIIEAQGGEVTLRDATDGRPGLVLSIPAARQAHS